MKICVNAAVSSRWLKEFEVKRSDLSPLMFWRLVKKAMEDHGEDLTDWIAGKLWVQDLMIFIYTAVIAIMLFLNLISTI